MSVFMLENWIDWVWYLTPAMQTALLIKLLKLQIAGRYRWFFVWTFVGLLQNLLLMALVNQPGVYKPVWIATLLLVAVFEVGAAWEIFRLRSRQYGGVRAFGRGLLIVVTVVAVVGALFAIGAELRAPGLDRLVKTTGILKRTLDSALALFLLIAGCVFLFFHETPVARNIVRHFRILTFYLTAIAAGFLVGNLTGKSGYTKVNLWLEVISVFCFAGWALSFSRAGENAASLPPATPEERARLADLDAQLSDLLKSVKF